MAIVEHVVTTGLAARIVDAIHGRLMGRRAAIIRVDEILREEAEKEAEDADS